MRGAKILKYIFFVILSMTFVSCGMQHEHAADIEEESSIDYYTCGMHPDVKVSPAEYRKGSVNCPICNMKLTPVYKERAGQELDKASKALFYRHPTDSSITSEEPRKNEEGIDYIPVYEALEEDGNYYACGCEGKEHVFLIKGIKGMTCPICGMPLEKISAQEAETLKGVVSKVKIQPDQIQRAGVRTEAVSRQHLFKEIRTVGVVSFDPELTIAEEEFISSLKTLEKAEEGEIVEIKDRALSLVESGKRKLKLLGLSDAQIKALEENRTVHTSHILPEEKMWIYGDVYEYELSWVKAGQEVKVTTSSLPGEEFEGIISSINPVLDPKTRSVQFRVEVDNPGLKLKPEMYVDIVIMSMYMSDDGQHMVLAIPKEAVLDTGTRRIIWVDKGNGEYEGRQVELGAEATVTVDGEKLRYYPVLRGLSEGELVVTKANFLIDSQSQISGVAAGAYSGALGQEEQTAPPVHLHH
ncbi:MAG: efflux RND transporter periplasmic adaptor subunit [Candidatus Omnitrophota bacterium]